MWKTLFILSFILFVNVIRCDNLNDSQSNQAEPPLEERDRTIEEELNAAADQEDLVAQQLVEDVMLEEKHFDIKLEAEIPDKAPFVEVKQEGPVPPASANNEPPPSNQFAKPRSVLKDIDHTDSTSYKEAPRQNQFAAPLPNQSAYYATPGIPQQREDAGTSGSKKHDAPAEQRASSTPKKPSMLADLASKLNRKISTDQRRRKQEQAEMLQRQQRFRVSRAHAAPVERVLEAYNDPHTDLYDVLGVRRSINDAALRKAYRASALAIHPGERTTLLTC